MLVRILSRSLIFLVIAGSAAACQNAASSTPTVDPSPTPAVSPSTTPTEERLRWEQVLVNGVMLGIQLPRGWHAQETDEGLLMAEHFGTMQSGTRVYGMQVHLFVYLMDGFTLPDSPDANRAWAMLKQIIEKPYLIGHARVSEPAGFKWDGHDAAYYLLNDGEGNRSVLLAVALNSPPRLVVCNFSSPADDAANIRAMLPEVLRSLTINGAPLDISAINELPDPLNFPEEYESATPAA